MSRSFYLVLISIAIFIAGCFPGWEEVVEDILTDDDTSEGDDDSTEEECADNDGDHRYTCPEPTWPGRPDFGSCDPELPLTTEQIEECSYIFTESYWPGEMGYLYNGLIDCNDSDPAIRPYADEICDGIDNDCNPFLREIDDFDGDGYTPCTGDCADDENDVYLGAPVVLGDGMDQDCDGLTE